MNAKHLLPAALIALAGASAFAGQASVNELGEQPQARSTLTREQVRVETRAAMAQGRLERSSYDEQESVALARQGQDASTTTRAAVKAETRAFYAAHPNAQYERQTYGYGG